MVSPLSLSSEEVADALSFRVRQALTARFRNNLAKDISTARQFSYVLPNRDAFDCITDKHIKDILAAGRVDLFYDTGAFSSVRHAFSRVSSFFGYQTQDALVSSLVSTLDHYASHSKRKQRNAAQRDAVLAQRSAIASSSSASLDDLEHRLVVLERQHKQLGTFVMADPSAFQRSFFQQFVPDVYFAYTSPVVVNPRRSYVAPLATSSFGLTLGGFLGFIGLQFFYPSIASPSLPSSESFVPPLHDTSVPVVSPSLSSPLSPYSPEIVGASLSSSSASVTQLEIHPLSARSYMRPASSLEMPLVIQGISSWEDTIPHRFASSRYTLGPRQDVATPLAPGIYYVDVTPTTRQALFVEETGVKGTARYNPKSPIYRNN